MRIFSIYLFIYKNVISDAAGHCYALMTAIEVAPLNKIYRRQPPDSLGLTTLSGKMSAQLVLYNRVRVW